MLARLVTLHILQMGTLCVHHTIAIGIDSKEVAREKENW